MCFPHAGGGVRAYRGWGAEQPDWLEISVAVLPGRDRLLGVPPRRSVDELVPVLVASLEPFFRQGPFAVFGHSVGALVGFEVCRALSAEGFSTPQALVVCGRRAPQLPGPEGTIHDRPDVEVLDLLRWYGDVPGRTLPHSVWSKLFLPALRADLALEDTYRHRSDAPLGLPLMAYAGDQDPSVTEAELRAWGSQTAAQFRARTLSGGHFFVQETPGVLQRVTDDLAEVVKHLL